MYLISTKDGLYEYTETLRKVGYEFNIYDALKFEDDYIVCSPQEGVVYGKEKIIDKACWRLMLIDRQLYASLAGPIIYDIIDRKVVLDLTKKAKEMGWSFDYTLPHINDIVYFKGSLVAVIEEGNLLKGESLEGLKPTDFKADMHNVFTNDKFMLIATADGVYYTEDLNNFTLTLGGYAHGFAGLNGSIVAQIMRGEPLYLTRDGKEWSNMGIRLPKPVFGQTAIAGNGSELMYSTTSVYKLRDNGVELVVDKIPLTRRISFFG
ncbi:hypothetical protein [Stygiolobus caldivivus]|uniref:Uncharacterized protein n=1 Tax=Stygiolobus caldivivus TaxID=2824673 RepID=A0A8D5ZKB8_9CREN|nr:hypothetical protein [Stygiolobus caldivivus]BCU71581.1 hypothetical protein KN1_28780 [Stygiolobus caldivivus]